METYTCKLVRMAKNENRQYQVLMQLQNIYNSHIIDGNANSYNLENNLAVSFTIKNTLTILTRNPTCIYLPQRNKDLWSHQYVSL